MQKLYKIVLATLLIALLSVQNNLQAQKCCVECQADVKAISDKQVLLEKIDIEEGTSLKNVNTNVYVSYRSGNSQKFCANLAIATAGVVVSTQLSNGNVSEGGKTQNAISPIVPLGVSVATLPGIWKNRPRGVPQAGLYIQHRDTRGKLLDTWEQPISSEAKNSAELLTVSIDKPLSAGTVEVYLQNGNKNGVYYWGLQTVKNVMVDEYAKSVLPPQTPKDPSPSGGCGDGQHPDVHGDCQPDGPELPEVVVIPTPFPPLPPWGPSDNPGSDGNNGNTNPNGTQNNPGGGGSSGGGSNEALEIRKRECIAASTKFNNDVSWARFIREESKMSCINAIGLSNWDAFSIFVSLLEGGTPVGLIMQVAGLFGSIDDMWACMTTANEQYNWDIESAYNKQQEANTRFDCAHLY